MLQPEHGDMTWLLQDRGDGVGAHGLLEASS